MNERRETTVIRRILVAVDASPHSQAALAAAVEMAAQFEAELLGIFVEDINLLRLGDLPFVQELGIYSARRRHVETEEMEQRLRARAQQLRRVFLALARRAAVRGDFHVIRGRVNREIASAAEHADLLILGRAGWSYVRTRQLGSTARAACTIDVPRVIVLMHEGAQLHAPLLVVYDGSPVGTRVLLMAAGWTQRISGPLQILLLADGEERIPELKRQVNQLLSRYPVALYYRALTYTNLPMLAEAIHDTGHGTLLLPAKTSLLQEDEIVQLMEMIDLPIVLVR